jgi:hypothetical protein
VKKWLTSLLNRYLPMVEHLTNDQAGIEAATTAAHWIGDFQKRCRAYCC